MTNISQQDIGDILENYADVIEGGNSYAGGTVYRGIPGLHSNDRFLRDGTDDEFTVDNDALDSTTTSFKISSSLSWPESRWVSDNAPPFFVVCTTSGGAGNPNINRSRKITGWNNTTKVFTIAPALPEAPISEDVFLVQQGFKRVPNGVDIESDEAEVDGGYDRSFHLDAPAGSIVDQHGAGYLTYKTVLRLRLRLLKHGRLHDWTRAAFANMAIIRAAVTKRENYDSTYTRALLATEEEAEIVKNDTDKIVIQDQFTLLYRVDATFQ